MRIARLPVALATAFALVALPGAAAAVEYTKMEPAGSKVAFQYQQLGVKLDGHFKQFSGQVSFDPAKPQTGKASLDVELGSVDAGSPDADSEVVTAPWFNVEKFPKAHFESTSIKAKGGDRHRGRRCDDPLRPERGCTISGPGACRVGFSLLTCACPRVRDFLRQQFPADQPGRPARAGLSPDCFKFIQTTSSKQQRSW